MEFNIYKVQKHKKNNEKINEKIKVKKEIYDAF